MDDIDDPIMDELMDDDDERSEDGDYDAAVEEDKGESEDREYDEYIHRIEQFEVMADRAPPIDNHQHVVANEVSTSKSVKKRVKRKGRGPTKGLGAREEMYLEYNEFDNPCGKWRRKYATFTGLCMRKISILLKWEDVPEGLKKTFWDDAMVSLIFNSRNLSNRVLDVRTRACKQSEHKYGMHN